MNDDTAFEFSLFERLQYDQDPADYMSVIVKSERGVRRLYVLSADYERLRELGVLEDGAP